MKKAYAVILLTIVALVKPVAQTVYSENFDGGLTWTLNSLLGIPEGGFPNQWFVSCAEEGVGSGFCGTPCSSAANQTLHISWNSGLGPDLGAAYFETGFGSTTTHRRAHSPNINTIGYSGMTLKFDIIAWGGNPSDFAALVYSVDGGTIWSVLAPSLTTLCCGGVICTGTDQGLWQTNTYLLPASCDGITNLRIGFIWNNTDDGIATDPSVAIDNLTITVPLTSDPPVALFSPEDITVCEGSDVTYTDLSTSDDVITSWVWTFGGGVPASATGSGPHTVNYSTPGTYTTTLEVTDGIGTHDTSFTIIVEPDLSAGTDALHDFCSSDPPADLFLDLGTADPGGTWSPSMTSGTGVYDPAVDPEVTYTYTITGVACPSESAEVMVILTPAPFAGSDVSLDFCSTDDSIDLFAEVSPADPGGFWVPALTSGSDYFSPVADGSGLYMYVVSGGGICPNDTAELDILVVTASFAGVDTSHAFCVTDGPADLFLDLPGADGGGTWTPAMTSGTGVFDPATDGSGIYSYTVDGTAPCPDVSAEVDVVIDALPNPGTDNSHDFCSNDAPYDLYGDLGFGDVGGTWSPAMSSGTGVFDPDLDAAGLYTYTVDGGGCPDSSATITVTVSTLISAGQDTLWKTCESQGVVDLNDLLSPDADPAGSWSDDDGTGALTGSVFDFSLVTFPGSYDFTYHQTNPPPCDDDSALITVQLVDCTSLDETSAAKFLIYPNPAKDVLHILSGDLQVHWIDLLTSDGRVLKHFSTSSVDIGELSSGTYMLRMYAGEKVLVARFVKN